MRATIGVVRKPKDERTSRNSRVIGMGTKLAPDTVKSDKPDFAVVLLIIQANEFAFHKTHVGLEIVRSAIASVEVRTDARERQIDLPDHPLEVGDDGRIVTGVAS